MMPVTKDFRRNQQSVFLKAYFAHCLEQKVKLHICNIVNMAYRSVAAAFLDLAGVQDVKEVLSEQSHR